MCATSETSCYNAGNRGRITLLSSTCILTANMSKDVSKIALSVGGSMPASDTWFLGAAGVHTASNGTSISLVIFAGLVSMSSRVLTTLENLEISGNFNLPKL